MPLSGVAYEPELEWRYAARWAGYKYAEEFAMLDGEEQSAIVAAYRIEHYVAAVLAQEQARESERRAARAKSKGRRRK